MCLFITTRNLALLEKTSEVVSQKTSEMAGRQILLKGAEDKWECKNNRSKVWKTEWNWTRLLGGNRAFGPCWRARQQLSSWEERIFNSWFLFFFLHFLSSKRQNMRDKDQEENNVRGMKEKESTRDKVRPKKKKTKNVAVLWQPGIKRSCLCWKAAVWSAPGERSKRKCEKLLITLGLGNGWTCAQCSFFSFTSSF